ncbi:MAG: dihydrofolate reductase family protein [Arachnia sp.]
MPATYTFDVFSTLDGYGSYALGGDWGGYWGKDGPELRNHRLSVYRVNHRMVLGANTFRDFERYLGTGKNPSGSDDWSALMKEMPTTVVSSSLKGPLDWPDVTVISGDAIDIVSRLKEESEMPLRSHGSLSLNRSLMAAGLVDRVQVTIFPVISGKTGTERIFQGAADFDLELLESRTFDGRSLELTYRPTLH